MSRIVFLKMDGEDQVEIRMDGDASWMDVAERFVGFLQACGYIVDGADIAQYMSETYSTSTSVVEVDLSDSWPDDTFAEPNTITVSTRSDYDFSALNNVMNTWSRDPK